VFNFLLPLSIWTHASLCGQRPVLVSRNIPIWLLKDRQYVISVPVKLRGTGMFGSIQPPKTKAGVWQARGYNPIARAPAPTLDSTLSLQDG